VTSPRQTRMRRSNEIQKRAHTTRQTDFAVHFADLSRGERVKSATRHGKVGVMELGF